MPGACCSAAQSACVEHGRYDKCTGQGRRFLGYGTKCSECPALSHTIVSTQQQQQQHGEAEKMLDSPFLLVSGRVLDKESSGENSRVVEGTVTLVTTHGHNLVASASINEHGEYAIEAMTEEAKKHLLNADNYPLSFALASDVYNEHGHECRRSRRHRVRKLRSVEETHDTVVRDAYVVCSADFGIKSEAAAGRSRAASVALSSSTGKAPDVGVVILIVLMSLVCATCAVLVCMVAIRSGFSAGDDDDNKDDASSDGANTRPTSPPVPAMDFTSSVYNNSAAQVRRARLARDMVAMKNR